MKLVLSGAGRTFGWIWLGQVASLIGSAMTSFALTIWIWQTTGQVTAVALVEFYSVLPVLLVGPFAGALVDRWDRRRVMMASDGGTALVTLILLTVYLTGGLEVWHLYATKIIVGICLSFQSPAYTAIVTVLLPKEHYARASGMLSLGLSGSWVLAPALAAFCLNTIGMAGIMCVDLLTFGLAMITLMLVSLPPATRPLESGARAPKYRLWHDVLFGFRYIWRRRSLLGLQAVLFLSNMLAMFGVLIPPMLLARSGNNEVLLGSVLSVGALGGVMGGLVVVLWGGPKRKINGVLLGFLGISLLGQVLMGIGRTAVVWSFSAFMASFFYPLVLGSHQAIWQSKVPAHLQGRVLAARRLVAEIAAPLTLLVAGPLADRIFEPAMAPGGALANKFVWLVGNGPGAGIALLYVLSGILGAGVVLGAYAIRPIREVESLLPDHDSRESSEECTQTE